MYHIFIHSSVKGHLGCFHVLTILIVLSGYWGGLCVFLNYGFTSDSDTHWCHPSCWCLEQCLTHSRHSKFVKRILGDSRRILVNKSSQVLYFNSANNQTQKECRDYPHISHGTVVTVHSIDCATAVLIYTLLFSLL